MDRRKFVSVGTTGLCLLPVLGWTAFNEYSEGVSKPQWLIDLIKMNDEQLHQLSVYQVKDRSEFYFGGFKNDAEIINPHSTCAFINKSCAAISCPESVYYRSSELLDNLVLALHALLRLQHEDGTIDLMDTNFHSTPDTGFMVKQTAMGYQLLQQSGTPQMQKALDPFKQFLQRAGEALITGGIHTPNHRWVVSAALTKLNELWPDPRYVNRIERWLSEHIDIDPDGQYNEKSTYGYSALVDRVLITIAKGMNKPALYDAVRKNLLMMRYYIHPNGEVVTEASNRQDKGTIGTMENYYYAYRYMSLKDGDAEMAAVCRLIEKTSFKSLTGILNYLLTDTGLWKELPAPKTLPVSYAKNFPYSGVVRIRRGEWDTTLLSNNPGWLTFHKGNAVLQGMRIAASFFGKGQFQSEEIKQSGDQWILHKELDGPYYQPYPKELIREDGDVNKMPRSNRPQSNVQHLATTITITENGGNGIWVDIDMKGTDRVPVSLELIFRKGGSFTGVQPVTNKTDAYLLNQQEGAYTVGNDTIHFGPGLALHKAIQLRGALPAMDASTVYLTGFTPFKHRIKIS